MSVLEKIVAPFTMKRSANDGFRARKGTVQKSKRQKVIRRDSIGDLKPYRAVSIAVGECACAAIRDVAGKRFLVVAGEVPELPLLGCDVARCSCKYVHHDDRRDLTASDRRQWSSMQSELYSAQGEENRRQTRRRGRRKAD